MAIITIINNETIEITLLALEHNNNDYCNPASNNKNDDSSWSPFKKQSFNPWGFVTSSFPATRVLLGKPLGVPAPLG